jgi:lysophospholipase L1-like esterase
MRSDRRWKFGSTVGKAAAILGFAACGAPAQAQGDIARWVAQDGLDPITPGGVLFTGSSSIRRWEQLTRDFADYRVIQRGFGGSQFEDLAFFVNDIVLPYQPAAIVVWSGTNDISTGEPGTEVFADYQAFVGLVHAALPATDIIYLGITPTPSNNALTGEIDTANGLISSMAAMDSRLHYVDLPAFFKALNPPNDPAFVGLYVDGVHLNRAGYDVWTSLIRPEVEAVLAANKVFTPNPLTPGPGDRVLVDFGPSNPEDGRPTISPDVNGNHWNNWHPADGNVAINAGERIAGLIDAVGDPTGVRLVITGGFVSNGRVNGGLLSPSAGLLGDFAVPTVTEDFFFFGADGVPGGGNDDIPGGFMLEGLDPDLVYELRFFGSRTASGETRITRYDVFGANTGSASLTTTGSNIGADGAYDGNDDTIATVGGIRPDAFGQVFVDLTVEQGTFGYINGFELAVSTVSIGEQPDAMVVDAGGLLVFTASVAGAGGAASLRWERDGLPLFDDARISGAATETLLIDAAGLADAGVYRLVATLGGETVTSAGAIGGVRASGLGDADYNGDGVVDARDARGFLEDFDAAP